MISYDSSVGDQIVSCVKDAGTSVRDNIANKVSADYSALLSVGLFSSQIESIKAAANELATCFESFSSVIAENKSGWKAIVEESKEEATSFATAVDSNDVKRTSTWRGGGTSGGGTSSYVGTSSAAATQQTTVDTVSKGKEISTNDVKEFITKIDSSIIPILIQKISKLVGEEALFELLTNKEKSDELVQVLKKILGDTTDSNVEASLDTENIQKQLLEKMNLDKVDIKTEEGISTVKNEIMKQLKTTVDESKWNELLYGNNTTTINVLNQNWVVAKTAQDVQSYANHLKKDGIRQDANPSEWGSSCLAFAEAHTYDLANGTNTGGSAAAGYAHSTSFKDYMSDNKDEVLAKIYEEVMNGRPCVLQVNGNKAGTSRHFVTVVGFKEGVVSASTLKETDLLIIDSWDGKIESMDTSSSRFMTSGKQCGKTYSGYRLRVLKS